MSPSGIGITTAVVLGSLITAASPAAATPATDLTAETLDEAHLPVGLPPTVTGTDLIARRIIIAPGGSTGWHYHDGPVLGFVAAGTLTHPGPDCVPVIYRAGEFLSEPAGAWNVHIGRNLGLEPVVLYVVYATPAGDPLFRDAPAPDCA
ncbi:cupin domain-containing protein [Nocardia higoensis]|uniref:cupin domain-containing protein n=1 Tax=Nocardia higoensis TaxID=228599 RepID=UPI0006876FE4|nr:cupin domain-containing protein [Nocardia higoensis]